MAIKVFAYKEVMYEECLDFIRWCQNALNLRDWDIIFELGNTRPQEYGDGDADISPAECIPQLQFLRAYIWISPDRSKILNVHPYELLAHEMLHVMFSLIMGTGMERDIQDDDILITRLEGFLVQGYCLARRKRLPKYIEF